MLHSLLLPPGISVLPLLPLTESADDICKFIFENSIGGGESKNLNKDVAEGRHHGRALKAWLW